jgi:hypothetical protein
LDIPAEEVGRAALLEGMQGKILGTTELRFTATRTMAQIEAGGGPPGGGGPNEPPGPPPGPPPDRPGN